MEGLTLESESPVLRQGIPAQTLQFCVLEHYQKDKIRNQEQVRSLAAWKWVTVGVLPLVLRIPTVSYRLFSREWKKENVLQKLHFYQLLILAERSPLEHGSWVGGVGDRTGWATVEEKPSEIWPRSVFVAPPLRPEGRNTVGNREDWVWELPHPENWTDPSSWASSLSSEGKNIFTRVF